MIDRLFNYIAYGIAFLILAGMLTGCATKAEPVVRTVEVRVPIREACVPPDVPGAPSRYADEGAAAMTPDERYLATARANKERTARLARIEPVIAGCR